MLSEPQPLSARPDFEDFAAARSGPPPPSHRSQGRRPVPSKLLSNKLPVVIRGPAASKTKQFPFADEWDNAGKH